MLQDGGADMNSFGEQHRSALMSCFEVVIMRRNDNNYHLVQAKLNTLCNRNLIDCYEYPKYLRDVLREVFKENYNSIINEVKLELGELVEEKDVSDFLKIMES